MSVLGSSVVMLLNGQWLLPAVIYLNSLAVPTSITKLLLLYMAVWSNLVTPSIAHRTPLIGTTLSLHFLESAWGSAAILVNLITAPLLHNAVTTLRRAGHFLGVWDVGQDTDPWATCYRIYFHSIWIKHMLWLLVSSDFASFIVILYRNIWL